MRNVWKSAVRRIATARRQRSAGRARQISCVFDVGIIGVAHTRQGLKADSRHAFETFAGQQGGTGPPGLLLVANFVETVDLRLFITS